MYNSSAKVTNLLVSHIFFWHLVLISIHTTLDVHSLSVDYIFISPNFISQRSTRVLLVVGNQVLSKHTAVIIVIFKGHHTFFIEEHETCFQSMGK